MRRKARAGRVSPGGARADVKSVTKARENTHPKAVKQTERPAKAPTGRGLGKAGAKRLGRLLKRAIQDEESAKGKLSLPKTPVRLFKHQIQKKAENGPKANAAKPASPHVSQLILSVVSHCKHRGGMSMAELKQTLAAEGYDVSKNSKQVTVVTKRLVNNETLQTTRNASLRLNNKTGTKQVRIKSVESPKSKADVKQSKKERESPKGAEKLQTNGRKTLKTKAKTSKSRLRTTKARRSPPKRAVKKRRPPVKQRARLRKAPRKAQRGRRQRPKQNRHPYKSSWRRRPTKRRLPKTRPRLRTRQRRVARRRAYYYD